MEPLGLGRPVLARDVGFVWIMLQPGSGYAEKVRHLDLVPVAVTCAAFAGLTLAPMAYFHFRRPRLPTATTADDSSASFDLAD
ncbi:MAG TPA: hypothetical protein VGG09_06780 [Acidimicrobiales bacterium]